MISTDPKNLIVVPFDFTDQSYTALEHASILASRNKDEVRMLHISNDDSIQKLKKLGYENESIQSTLESVSKENLSKTNVKTSFQLESGHFLTGIGKYVKSSNASFCVMGTHGVHGMQHILGAHSLKLVTSSTVPVIIVQKKILSNTGYSKIVLPIDGNNRGKNKIAYAVEIAKRFNSEVFIFEAHSFDDYVEHRIRNNSDLAKDYLSLNKIKCTTEKQEHTDNYSKQILRYASQVDANLIIISSHHDQDVFMDFFIGSDELRIINNDAQIATMCVNPIEPIGHLDIASFNW